MQSETRFALDVFFEPRNVAVIGATEASGSIGRTLISNLTAGGFGSAVFPVNPKRSSVLGVKAYSRIADVPQKVDLALVATPAATVPEVIGECSDAGVKGAVIISAGFREVGESGAALEREVLRRHGTMRLIGPNCMGVMSPYSGLNATLAGSMARPGPVAFISQSGALGAAVLDWGQRELVGFSAFISVGSMIDVGWGDLIQRLGDDPHTGSILIYMESIGDARSFLTAAREVALSKPIIVLKPGRTKAAARAAASHTGALTGEDEVLDAAFRRCGVLRVNRVSDLFYMSEALSKQPRPRGPRLTIVTNAGGPAVLATDALISTGGQLAELSSETMARLNDVLPPHWSHANPVDVLGDATPERYARAVEIAANDPGADGLLIILTPQAMTDSTQIAARLQKFAMLGTKPVLASWMGGAETAAGESLLKQSGVPTFPYADTAARAFESMWRYSYNLRALYETPAVEESGDISSDPRQAAHAIMQQARERGRTLLTEAESKQILKAYGIPVVETLIALGEDQAVEAANRLGYPVAVKVHSETIRHKAAAGGVHLNLSGDDGVRRAWRAMKSSTPDFLAVTVQPMIQRDGYELIIGSSVDPQFGPVLLFGAGGRLVEVFKDRSLGLPPLNTTLARRMMEQTRIFSALTDTEALEQLLVRFSRLVVELPWIREIDINPLLATGSELLALDAHVTLHPPDLADDQLPRPAIRPYPAQYCGVWDLKDAGPVAIRPIRPEDEPLMVRFHEQLSERSVYFRYFHSMKLDQRVTHERLARICFIDYDREIALVAIHADAIVAVGRLVKLPRDAAAAPESEFAILISDAFQKRGMGVELLRRLVEIARAEKVRIVSAEILPENRAMQRVCEQLGFRLRHSYGDGVVRAEYTIED
jgi:acetyltransferase